MKSITLIALTLFICTPAFCGDFHGSRACEFRGTSYQFDLSKIRLSNTPKWQAESDFPPLSAKKAKDIALLIVKELRPEIKFWHLDYVKIEPLVATPDWIYLVKYSDFTPPISGLPSSLEIPIYMDGTIPELKVVKIQK